jgi:hypothetical protein
MISKLNELFANQITKIINKEIVDGHNVTIVEEVHKYLEDFVNEILREKNLSSKYYVKREESNKLAVSNQKGDLTLFETGTNRIVFVIEYSSARTSFIKNKSNNAANLISEAVNYSFEGIPLLWIFNTSSVLLEELQRFDSYKDELLEYFKEESQSESKVKKSKFLKIKDLSINKLKEVHMESFYNTKEKILNSSKGKNIFKDVEILIGMIDYDYENLTCKNSDFSNFDANSPVTIWLKEMNDSIESRIRNFVTKYIK